MTVHSLDVEPHSHSAVKNMGGQVMFSRAGGRKHLTEDETPECPQPLSQQTIDSEVCIAQVPPMFTRLSARV